MKKLIHNPLVILIPVAILYLSQHLYSPVTSMDEAQQADYLQRIISGRLPYRDFIDIYGPLNWFPPAAAYKIFGEKWFGVRVWMLFIQMTILFLIFKITMLVADQYYAVWSFMVALLFLGIPMPLNYTPYACMQSYPFILAVIWLILKQKFRIETKALIYAGICTGIVIFLKISTGLFLCLSVLLIYFFNNMPLKIPQKTNPSVLMPKVLFASKFIVLACYFFVFTSYIVPHYEKQYFWHLTLPLLFGIFILSYLEIIKFTTTPKSCYLRNDLERIKTCCIFGCASLLTIVFFMGLFFPLGITGPMLTILPQILKEINYSLPFSPLGSVAKTKVEMLLMEGWWLQLPWTATFLFLLILISYFLRQKKAWTTKELFKCTTIWIVTILCHYVIYPTADLGHLTQNTILWILFFCTGISFLEDFAIAVNYRFWFRAITTLLLLCWIVPLFNTGSYLLDKKNSNYYQNLVAIGNFIRANSTPQDQCFILSKDKLIHFYSGKELYGTRDTFLFYLIPHGRLSRKSFMNLSPARLQKLIHAPPKFIIDHDFNGGSITKKIFPEIKTLIANHYQKVFRKAQIIVYARN